MEISRFDTNFYTSNIWWSTHIRSKGHRLIYFNVITSVTQKNVICQKSIICDFFRPFVPLLFYISAHFITSNECHYWLYKLSGNFLQGSNKMKMIYRIFSYTFRGNYSFMNLEIAKNSNSCYISNFFTW